MIDIHSHILYGLDDGAQNAEDTLNMAKQAVENGIHTIVATPHHLDGTYTNPPEVIRERTAAVEQLLAEHQIPLRIVPGMEIHIHGEVVEELKQDQLLTVNQQQRHILLELPHDHLPRYVDQLIFQIQLAGFVPIIPHPERNKEISADLNLLYRLVKRGAMSQLTAASVAGKFGKNLQKISLEMIKHNLVHFIATDAHNTGSRGAVLAEAYQVINQKVGTEYTKMYQHFAEDLLKGRDCDVPPPIRLRKKLFGIF
ncbi:tyrosine-protein phosphatase [Ammoniphilus resinae]|uniref:Tyrosine-protein phosphatase n=1 Tax=Ammoniphilus resinae TaxID=861532 RepID=A0ABS4GY57_9BACL|nr:CpsB/CapC family capsule biosynthesis tyrosine phosphatase [Ammoniphilus resinae]MBP1934972.1 protein-tyrosine phosphatase [Ammoniphilus resinae]